MFDQSIGQCARTDETPDCVPMINEISFQNFKGFKSLKLTGLGQINVIVGGNGVGKTSFLEGLFLALGGGPETMMRTRLWRGLGQMVALQRSQESYDKLWKELFYLFDKSNEARIECCGDPANSRTVRFKPQKAPTLTIPLNGGPKKQPERSDSFAMSINSFERIEPIEFVWTVGGHELPPVTPTITNTGLEMGIHGAPTRAAFYAAGFSAIIGPSEAARQFSEFSRKKLSRRFTSVLRKVYPEIRDITAEPDLTSDILYCDIKWLPEKIPVASVSGGANKLLCLLLGIASQTDGVVLIDEIENGFHYTALKKTWAVLVQACLEYRVQLFVTTHSKECLEAILPILDKHEDDFRLLRLTRATDTIKAKLFSGINLEAAIKQDLEIR